MNNNIITKADLLRIPKERMQEAMQGPKGFKQVVRTFNTETANQKWYAEKANGNLYVQDYTGVNPVISNINSATGAGRT